MKKGISIASLIIVIIVMTILAGVIVVTGYDTFESIDTNKFALEILDVQNAVDYYYYRHEKYPAVGSYILDTTTIADVSQFSQETITDETITFKLVDLSAAGINETEFGKGSGRDIYVLSEATGIVYYLAGVSYENKTYYTMTDEIYTTINVNSNTQVFEGDIKVYDVIFTPNTTQNTNEPVAVTVKLPKNAVINSVITTDEKSIGEESLAGTYKEIKINETSANKTGNYTITVNYTYRGTTKTAEYKVENYNVNVPQVTFAEMVNGDVKTVQIIINANNSSIKKVKYEEKIITDKTYFENYGKTTTNNQFVISKDSYFTIYVETQSGVSVMIDNKSES